jgi:hypothetical protein
VILLSWTSVGILRENQAYLVELETPGQVTPTTYTTQATSWRLLSEQRPTGRSQAISWWVTVVDKANTVSGEPPQWEPLSLPSETRNFVWW